jgi:hypothetical protein
MSTADGDVRLERWYRWLLIGYPGAYRQDRGDELVSTLLATARPGQRVPSIAEAIDLLCSGLRTRARIMRHTMAGPVAADVLGHATVVALVVASAVATALIVGVSLLGQPVFYRYPQASYPMAVRVGVGSVLATLPATLAATWVQRLRLARLLAAVGAVGSVGFASWLATHALSTQRERHALFGTDQVDRLVSVPDESLEPSNLFALVTLLCVPAVLLIAVRSTSAARLRVGRQGAFAVLLGAVLIVLTATDLLQRARLATLGPEGTSVGPAPSLHDTGLTGGVAVTLIAVAAWHAVGRRRSRNRAIACVMMMPVLGYAIGTFVTPILFRPGMRRTEGLPQNLLEVALVVGVIAVLAASALASVREPRNAR